jgi:hypothetical protein
MMRPKQLAGEPGSEQTLVCSCKLLQAGIRLTQAALHQEQCGGRGRDAGCPAPPTQIRACAANAHTALISDVWRKIAPKDKAAVLWAEAVLGQEDLEALPRPLAAPRQLDVPGSNKLSS